MIRRHVLAAERRGDPAMLHDAIAQLAGPGYYDFPDAEPMLGLEGLEALLMRDGTPRDLARRVAFDTLDWARKRADRARSEAELYPERQALDLARIVPIPDEIRAAGVVAGAAWQRKNWGGVISGKVELDVAQALERPRGRPAARAAKTWLTTRAEWRWWDEVTPAAALGRLPARWPALKWTLAVDGRVLPLTGQGFEAAA